MIVTVPASYLQAHRLPRLFLVLEPTQRGHHQLQVLDFHQDGGYLLKAKQQQQQQFNAVLM